MTVIDQPRSVSQTQQYEECGYRYWLQRVQKVPGLPAAWSHHGTAFHAAAEAFERSGRLMGIEEAVQTFSDKYSALTNEALEREPKPDKWLSAGRSGSDDIVHRYALGQEQTAEYVQWANKNQPAIWTLPSDGAPALELYFLVTIGDVQVRGYIDQLITLPDGSVRVRDLKTGTTHSKFQLETYAVAMRQQYGLTVNDGDWYFGKKGRLSRPVALTNTTEREVGERYAAMDAGVKAGRFKPNPGYHCRFCDMKHKCPFSTDRS